MLIKQLSSIYKATLLILQLLLQFRTFLYEAVF